MLRAEPDAGGNGDIRVGSVGTDLEDQGAHVIVEVKKPSSVDIQNGIEGVPAPLVNIIFQL